VVVHAYLTRPVLLAHAVLFLSRNSAIHLGRRGDDTALGNGVAIHQLGVFDLIVCSTGKRTS
jgi:hypothetical protein